MRENVKKTIILKLSAMGVFATHPPSCMLLAYKKLFINLDSPLLLSGLGELQKLKLEGVVNWP